MPSTSERERYPTKRGRRFLQSKPRSENQETHGCRSTSPAQPRYAELGQARSAIFRPRKGRFGSLMKKLSFPPTQNLGCFPSVASLYSQSSRRKCLCCLLIVGDEDKVVKMPHPNQKPRQALRKGD